MSENQRLQIATFMNDFHNQTAQAEQELQQQYQELVNLKVSLEAYSANLGVTGDANALRQIRQQINQEQNEVTSQLENLRDEKTKLNAELELVKKEIERVNAETSQINQASVGPLTGAMSGMSLIGDAHDMLGPSVPIAYNPRIVTQVDPRLVNTAPMGMSSGINPAMFDPYHMMGGGMGVADPRLGILNTTPNSVPPAIAAEAESEESQETESSSEVKKDKKEVKEVKSKDSGKKPKRQQETKKGKTDDKKEKRWW